MQAKFFDSWVEIWSSFGQRGRTEDTEPRKGRSASDQGKCVPLYVSLD